MTNRSMFAPYGPMRCFGSADLYLTGNATVFARSIVRAPLPKKGKGASQSFKKRFRGHK